MTSIKEKLKQARRRETTEDVCLRGDLAGEYEQLEKQLAALPPNNKLGGDPQRVRIEAELERVRAEMQDGTVPFTLRALSDSKFQRLIDAHPVRRDGDDVNERDAELGYDRSTFYPALIKASVVEPTLDAEDWELLFDEGLSRGQMSRLRDAALVVNGQSVDVPFSRAASSESQG
jgi:hypothetical protein